MLTTLELENYRGFGKYRLTGLDRVNLLVGKNNCGKTSVLEAVHFLVAGGDFAVLADTASQRGEMVPAMREPDEHRRHMYPVVSHFFCGHALKPGAYFAVRTCNSLGSITVRVVNVADLYEQGKQKWLFAHPEVLFEEEAGTGTGTGANLAICVEGGRFLPEESAFPVTEEGAILPDVLQRYRRSLLRETDDVEPTQFITPDSLEPRSMGEMWNKVIADARESEVIEAMKILAPGLENIFFLSGESAYRFGGRGGVLAAFKGTRRREPLGSYGGGMRRLLALSLSLVRSEGGVLLVDEIDTGLHYSIMGDMWRLVTEAARRSNVQVFATTHSSDCVRGVAWLCENHPELAADISLQKIDCDLEEAVALHGEEIVLAEKQGMEVR